MCSLENKFRKKERAMAYNIRKRRRELGLTLAEVANAVGVSKGTVSKWESGKTQNMRADNAYNLATILGVSVIEILSGEETQGRRGESYVPPVKPPGSKFAGVSVPDSAHSGGASTGGLAFDDSVFGVNVLTGGREPQISTVAGDSAFEDSSVAGNALGINVFTGERIRDISSKSGSETRHQENGEKGNEPDMPAKGNKNGCVKETAAQGGNADTASIKPLIFKDCAGSRRHKRPHTNQDLFKSSNTNIYNPTGKVLSKDSLFANSDYSWQTAIKNSTDGIDTDVLSDSTASMQSYGQYSRHSAKQSSIHSGIHSANHAADHGISHNSEHSAEEAENYATLMLLRNGCEPTIMQLSANGFAQIIKTIEAIKASE